MEKAYIKTADFKVTEKGGYGDIRQVIAKALVDAGYKVEMDEEQRCMDLTVTSMVVSSVIAEAEPEEKQPTREPYSSKRV